MASFSISRPPPKVTTVPAKQLKAIIKDNIFASDFDEIFDSGKKTEGASDAPVEVAPPPVYYNSSVGASISRPANNCPDTY